MPDLTEPALPNDWLSRNPQPHFTIDDLTLRPFTEKDIDAVVEAFTEPAMQRFHMRQVTTADYKTWMERRNHAWTNNNGAYWAVERDGKVVASTGFRHISLYMATGEVAYWVHPNHRSQGLATKPLRHILNWGFNDCTLHRITLQHSTQNPNSARVAEAAGFTSEGIQRSAVLHPDGRHDMHQWAKLAHEHHPQPQPTKTTPNN